MGTGSGEKDGTGYSGGGMTQALPYLFVAAIFGLGFVCGTAWVIVADIWSETKNAIQEAQ